MISIVCQSDSFLGRLREFPAELLDQKVEIRHSMTGIRRTKIKTACRRRFTVIIELLSKANYDDLRTFILAYHGQNMNVTFSEAQRQDNTGLPIRQDFGPTIDTSLIVKLLTVPVIFTSQGRFVSEVELEFEEVV